jgi:hypothetical protein|tara:strand:- start:794 stop:922 length:129 start_codon:yes stop_codon:yes gene_type:complete
MDDGMLARLSPSSSRAIGGASIDATSSRRALEIVFFFSSSSE